jgi:hypothetical protein
MSTTSSGPSAVLHPGARFVDGRLVDCDDDEHDDDDGVATSGVMPNDEV